MSAALEVNGLELNVSTGFDLSERGRESMRQLARGLLDLAVREFPFAYPEIPRNSVEVVGASMRWNGAEEPVAASDYGAVPTQMNGLCKDELAALGAVKGCKVSLEGVHLGTRSRVFTGSIVLIASSGLGFPLDSRVQ